MKSVVLTHGDVDGLTSGAIGILAFPGANLYLTRPSQIHQDLFRIAKDEPDVVSISDIAINVMRFDEILRALSKFPESTTIHWTDHHISGIIARTCPSNCPIWRNCRLL